MTDPRITSWLERPISYSQLASFDYDPNQWFDKYILGKEPAPSAAMLFGNTVGESFGTDTPLVPGIVRYSHMEYPLEATLNGVKLVGYADSYDPEKKLLREYKTSWNPKRWTQATVDAHDQLTMYALLLLLQDKVAPEKLTIHLDHILTRETGDFQVELVPDELIKTYPTKRTTAQVLAFGASIAKTRRDMERYAQLQLALLPA